VSLNEAPISRLRLNSPTTPKVEIAVYNSPLIGPKLHSPILRSVAVV
jgi:hypothetical protein